MSATRVERNKAANIDTAFYDGDQLANADGPVTVTVTRSDGTALVTDAATTNPSVGVYRYALAPQADLDVLTLTFTGTWGGAVQTETQHVEIVGDFYLTLASIRALPNLGDPAKFTTAELADARTWFEDTFEDFTGVAWVPRYARVTLDGTASPSIILPHMATRTVRSVTTLTTSAASTPFTAAEVADLIYDGSGVLRRWNGSFLRGYRYVIAYEHGMDAPPSDVVEAAKVAIADKLRIDHSGVAATRQPYSVQTGDVVERFSTPGDGRPFGISFVDAVARRRSVHGGAGSVAIA